MPVDFDVPDTGIETAEEVSRRLARPGVKLPDGSMGSVRSISVGDERGEWVIPTIVDAKPVSNDEAIQLWRQGKNEAIGGPFKTTKEADDYSWRFHLAEEKRGRLPGVTMPTEVDVPGVGVVEFPEDMGQEEIAAALNQQLGKPRTTRGMTPTAKAGPQPAGELPDLSRVKPTPYEEITMRGGPQGPWGGYSPFSQFQADRAQHLADVQEAFQDLMEGKSFIPPIPRLEGKSTLGKMIAAPVNVASGLVEGAASPLGALAAAAGTGPVGRAAVKALFSYLVAKGAGQQLGEASVTGDPQQVAEGLLGGALAGGIALPGVGASPEHIRPFVPGSALRVPPGARAPIAEPTVPPELLTPEQAALEARAMQRRATAAYEPPKPARAAVPETPPESERTLTEAEENALALQGQVEQVRKANARTTAQVQAIIPDTNRQQAARIRNLAWGTPEQPAPKAPPAPPEAPPAAASGEPVPKPPPPPTRGPATTAEVLGRAPEPAPPAAAPMSDRARYDQIAARMKQLLQADDIESPEYNALRGELEVIKNRQVMKGKPPPVEPATPEAPAPGMVRLYSGKGGAAGGGQGGSWFTENPQRAASFGRDVSFVDVPEDVAAKGRQPIKTDYVLPDEWVRKAKPTKLEQAVHEIPEEEAAPAKPAETPVAEAAKEGTPPAAQLPGIADKAVSALEAQAEKARARIAARQSKTTFGAGPLHELPNAADYALVGAAKLARFGLEKARWVAEMVKDFGERIRPHLDRLYDDARALVAQSARIAKAQETPVQDIIRQAVPISPAKPEAATQVIDTMQSSIRTARALRDHFTDAPKVSRAEVKAADDWLEADANRIRESLTELVKTSLPVAERGRFITAINNATKRSPILTGDPESMYRHAAEVAGRIEDRAVEVRKAGVVSDIKAAVTKAMDLPGVDIGYKQRILAVVQRIAFGKPSAATARALKATRDYLARMEAAGQDVDMPRDVLDSLEVLHQIPAGELPLDVLEALRDKVNQLATLGRLKVKARQQVWEIEKKAKIRELNQEPTNPLEERPEMRRQPGDPRPLSIRIRNFINRCLNAGALADKAILPIDAIFDLLGDAKGTYRGWLFRHFRNPLDLDYNAAGALKNRLTAPVDAIIKKHKLGQVQAERIGVFAATMQEGGMDRLIEMGVKPETIDQVLKTITPAETQAYQAMRASMEATFPEVQKLMHDLYNIAVNKEDNYFPMPRDWNQYDPGPPPPKAPKFGSEIDFDELAGWKAMLGDYGFPKTMRTERGFTITRKPGAATPIKVNAFDVFYRHINDVTYLLKTQRDLKMMGEMVRGDLFPAKYGKIGQNVVLSWLDTVARQGQVSPLRRWRGLDTLRRNTTVGVIGFRIASQFVHASNIPLAMWRAGGPEWWRSGLAESLSERGDKFMRENFVETFTRGGAEPALVEASERNVTAFGRTIVPKKVVKAGFAIARAIDRYNAQATALGAYLRLLNEKGLDWRHYDEIPVDKESQAQALVLTRRAVASPLFKDVSPSLSRGALTGGNVSVGRSLWQFQNVFQDQWSNIRHDLARAGIREKNPRLAATAFVALMAMGLAEMGIRTTVKSGIASATGYKAKKEEGAEAKMLKEAVRRLPFGGQLTTAIQFQRSGIPVVDAPLDVLLSGTRAVTAKKAAAQDKAKIRAASGALQLMGVPGASQVGELIEKSY